MTRADTPMIDRRGTMPRALALAFGLSALVGACSDGGSNDAPAADPPVVPPPDSTPSDATPPSSGETGSGSEGDAGPLMPSAAETSARYRVVLDARWSLATHPEGFPGNPHFSGLVGAVHGEQVRFWEPGQIASDGIGNVAETGGKDPFRAELRAAIDDGRALALIDGPGVSVSPGQVEVEVAVTRDYPELTLVTMLAPSPDWFVGVHGLSLREDGAFVEGRTVELPLYDSGTDSGLGYVSANRPTEPRSPIARVTSEPGDSPFVDGGPSVGTLRIERIE